MGQNKIKKPEFSIVRFESAMNIAGLSWKDIDAELGIDTKTALTAKEPSLAMVRKACSVIGLNKPDYVIMRSNDFKIVTTKPERLDMDGVIPCDILNIDMLEMYINETGWSWKTLAGLMSSKTILSAGKNYLLKNAATLHIGDLDCLCWALSCKRSDISYIKADIKEQVPKRVLTERQSYILRPDALNGLSKYMDKICKYANVPTWFIYSERETRISLELARYICAAINRVANVNMSVQDLCEERPLVEISPMAKKDNYRGNKRYSSEQINEALKMLENKSYAEVTKLTGISIATLIRANKKRKEENKKVVTEEPVENTDSETSTEVEEPVENTDSETSTEVEEPVESTDSETSTEVEEPVENTDSETSTEVEEPVESTDSETSTEVEEPMAALKSEILLSIELLSDEELDKLVEYIDLFKKIRCIKSNLIG